MTAELPRPRSRPYRIGLVCLGNICRSPMAQVVLAELVDRAGLSADVEVTSCGTGGWHVDEPMDRRAAATLVAAGYDPSEHRGRRLDRSWADHDVLLAMDADNLGEVERLLPGTPALLFRAFDPLGPGDAPEVPDPYYGGDDGFEAVLTMVERTSTAIVAELERQRR